MLPLSKGVQQEGIRVAHQQNFNVRMLDQQKPADTEAIFASFGLAPPMAALCDDLRVRNRFRYHLIHSAVTTN
jgi:hypothetical protein